MKSQARPNQLITFTRCRREAAPIEYRDLLPAEERGLAGIYQMMKRSSSDCPPAAYAFKNEVSNFAQFLPCALP
jgi:hypothetical protein